VFRIAASEFLAQLRIEAFPESGEVGGGLNRALAGGQKLDDERHLSAGDSRGFAHSEEVLQAGCDPGRLAAIVVDSSLPASGQVQSGRRDVVQQRAVHLAFERGQESGGGVFELREAPESFAQASERGAEGGIVEPRDA